MSDGSSLRVGFVDNSGTFGGAMVALGHLVRGLSDQGVEYLVVSGQDEDPSGELSRSLGYRHVSPTLPWVGLSTARRWSREPPGPGPVRRAASKLLAAHDMASSEFPDASRYLKIIRASHCQLVHLNNSIRSQLPATLAAWMARVPAVAHARGFQSPNLAVRIGRRVVRHHFAVSKAIRDDLLDLGIPAERVSVVHDAVDPTLFGDEAARGQTRAELGIPDGVPVFALFTRVVRWKGVLEFVEVAERVRAEMPDSVALVVGDESDGSTEYFQEVRRRGRPLEARGGLRFLGYRPDIPDLMTASDIIVHCSIEPEPFGMVIIEGMASRRPVVAMGEGGPLDIVEDGKTGILVPPRDPAALAQALIRLLQEPAQKRAEMGDLGRRRVENRFTHTESAQKVAEVYRSILGRGS